MGLSTSLQIGRSALNASQVAIQTTGNNLANAATPGYSRQIVSFAPIRDTRYGSAFVGRGVQLGGIQRQVDSALMARLNAGISQESAASTNHDLLSAVEATLNELSDNDISSGLSSFFNIWSELANTPGNNATRTLVVQQGSTLAGQMRAMRSDLLTLRAQVDQQLDANTRQADDLLNTIASLNREIVDSEGGSGQANGLRDQRDTLVQELSQYLDITAVEQPDGSVNVLIGSLPVVLGGDARGIELQRRADGSDTSVDVYMRQPHERVEISSGRIGALLDQRGTLVNDTIEQLDRVAGQLIFQVNRLHSQGYSTTPMTSVTGTQTVSSQDFTRALNDPANTSFASLPFRAENGGFSVTVRNSATGETQTVRIDVDLDGIDSTGAAGTADDTSLQDIRDALNAVPNLSATINANGTLSINGASGFDFSFSDDSSGALAALGVNTYFTGTDASNINVRRALVDQPTLLNAGRMNGTTPNDNGTAMAITLLQDQAIGALGGSTIRSAWSDAVQQIGIRTDAAGSRADATSLVRESLQAQQSAVSGVSIDEESINLITYQRQYQGAARFISVVDELTQTLMSIL
jgi:flagellar hook-associated protein 1 FlgK